MSQHAKIYGRRPVEEAFQARQRFEQVWLDHRGIVIPQKQRAPVDAAAVKASAGALSHLPIARVSSLVSFVRLLRDREHVVVCIEGRGKREVESIDLLSQPVAFVLGSEGDGISASVRKASTTTVRLPQAVAFDSYNVSVAAGMLAYEFLRQNSMLRWAPEAKKEE